MADPTDEGFYAILRTTGPNRDSDTDEIVKEPTKSLHVVQSWMSVLDDELTPEQKANEIHHYYLPWPIQNRHR